MNNNFGNLSLGAAEWKPHLQENSRGVNMNTSSNSTSDLNAGQVKEFVPGQGWTVSPSNAQVVTSGTNDELIGR